MSTEKKQIRERFREQVFARDKHKCRVCGKPDPNLAAHHITDRTLLENGGYVRENGIALCESCHLRAEAYHQNLKVEPGFWPGDLYALIGSSKEKALEADYNAGGDGHGPNLSQ